MCECVCLWQLLSKRSFEFTDWTVYRFCAKVSCRNILLRTSSVEVLVVPPQAARSTDGVNRSLHINWGCIDRGTALLPWFCFVAIFATYTLYCDGYCLHLLILLSYPWCLSPHSVASNGVYRMDSVCVKTRSTSACAEIFSLSLARPANVSGSIVLETMCSVRMSSAHTSTSQPFNLQAHQHRHQRDTV